MRTGVMKGAQRPWKPGAGGGCCRDWGLGQSRAAGEQQVLLSCPDEGKGGQEAPRRPCVCWGAACPPFLVSCGWAGMRKVEWWRWTAYCLTRFSTFRGVTGLSTGLGSRAKTGVENFRNDLWGREAHLVFKSLNP